MLRDEVDWGSEGYSPGFLGKDYANLIASVDTTTVAVPDVAHNSKPENKDSGNIYISGDNPDALKPLPENGSPDKADITDRKFGGCNCS